MKMNEYVDVLIPRGGRGLIKAVVNGSTIPVIETGTGNCHIYVDESCGPCHGGRHCDECQDPESGRVQCLRIPSGS